LIIFELQEYSVSRNGSKTEFYHNVTENPQPASQPAVLVFLKAPHPGKVKTRLSRTIGADAACEVYRRLAETQLSRIPDTFATEIHFAPADAEDEMRAWLGDSRSYFPQAAGNLGRRLVEATNDAFRRGASEVLCAGGDCPGLGGDRFASAAAYLRAGAEIVLGPCEDGGYYLVAMRSPQPEIFREIPWSSPETLAATRAKAKALGLEVALLGELYDVDDARDLERAQKDGLL